MGCHASTVSIGFTVVPIPVPKSQQVTSRPNRRVSKPVIDTFLCPNCDQRFRPTSARVICCSLQCKDEAKAVRYARRKYAEYPGGLPEDIEYAIGMKIAHALSGGYDGVARALTAATRELVIKRDGGKCVTCGHPGEEIDHIDGPSPDLSNLRLLCIPCHHAVTDLHLNPISDTETAVRRDALVARIKSEMPILVCDDEQTWATEWRVWRLAHTTWK